ncbi:MAG TPA: PEGA domain-containing protein [Patescibacteria group bacterium]|nr:PEGA domain-containing protein [Patescibacteria group bacterium]
MDFLDPQKQKTHARRLAIGYALIGLVLFLGTTILLYLAYGFGIDKNGRVIQNGLVFFSSQPANADIYINGEQKTQTNTRLVLPAGSYTAEIKRSGYHTWKRAITVEGGSVERFDYAFLFPTSFTTTSTKQYSAAPGMATQSPDRRWLLVQGTTTDSFDLFDTTLAKPVAKPLTISTDLYTPSSATKSWQVVQWADDNRHVVLKRGYEKNGQLGSEYILFDRGDPTASQNLSLVLGVTPTTLELRAQKYDQYYLYDQNAQQVLTANLKKPTPQSYIKDVAAFKSDEDMIMYVTSDGAPAGKMLVRLRQGDNTYTLRQTSQTDQYLLQLAQYNGAWFVAAGSKNEDKVYVYKNPIDVLKDKNPVLVPVQILKVSGPTFVSFSPNARFVIAENADHFAVYDAETDKGYAYQVGTPLDSALTHAEWMDSFRMEVVSSGKLAVFDFDGANPQTLIPLNPALPAFFDRNYRNVYTFSTQNALDSTILLAPQDR